MDLKRMNINIVAFLGYEKMVMEIYVKKDACAVIKATTRIKCDRNNFILSPSV